MDGRQLLLARPLETLTRDERHALVNEFYWYHTIDLGAGVRTPGTVDHAPVLHAYGFPSVAGRTVLDVGTNDGYFAFLFERLGAARVVATDIDRWVEAPAFDLPPRTRARRMKKYQPAAGEEAAYARRLAIANALGVDRPNPFYLAARILRSRAQLRYATIYDLAALEERFDLVFVGTLLSHVQDLCRALEAVRHVTRQQAVFACSDVLDEEAGSRGSRMLLHLIRALRMAGRLGDQVLIARDDPAAVFSANGGGSIWRPSVACLRELLLSAGFRDVQVYGRFALPNLRRGTVMRHVVLHAYV